MRTPIWGFNPRLAETFFGEPATSLTPSGPVTGQPHESWGATWGVETRTAQWVHRGPSAVACHRRAVHQLASQVSSQARTARSFAAFEIEVRVNEMNGYHVWGPAVCWSERSEGGRPLDAEQAANSIEDAIHKLMWVPEEVVWGDDV